MLRRFSALALCCAALAACGHSPRLEGGPNVTVLDRTELPAPEDLAVYRIGGADRIEVDVFGIEDMKREMEVDANGNISFPLVGEVQAQGRTPGELARVIEEALRRAHVRNPQVTVNVRETRSRLVAVEGSVREPGLYPVFGRLTLLGAVASAKGLTETASDQHAVVFRRIGSQEYAALYSVRAIREGNYEDPVIFPNDRLVIGESGARRTFRDITSTAPLLLAPVVAVLQSGAL